MHLTVFEYLLASWLLLAGIVFVVLLKVRAPYGRHTSAGWGPTLDHRVGWFVMELPAAIVFAWVLLVGDNRIGAPVMVFLCLWQVHYVNRSIVFPMRMTKTRRSMPLVIVGSAVFFNVINGLLNGFYLGTLAPVYTMDWFSDPRFVVGAILFAVGFAINLHSDNILLQLRRDHGGEYQVPRGRLFELVSCPNYFGEIVEWIGFAVMTWSPAAAAFAIWTAANLIPRALAHHRWYRERFASYPAERRAIVPYLL